MKGYSTKYALTAGIQEVEVEDLRSGADPKYRYTKRDTGLPCQLKVGTTFFEVAKDAEENVSLKNQSGWGHNELLQGGGEVVPRTERARWAIARSESA